MHIYMAGRTHDEAGTYGPLSKKWMRSAQYFIEVVTSGLSPLRLFVSFAKQQFPAIAVFLHSNFLLRGIGLSLIGTYSVKARGLLEACFVYEVERRIPSN